MNKNYYLFIIIFFATQSLNAQIIKGTITDQNTDESLIGVNIISENGLVPQLILMENTN